MSSDGNSYESSADGDEGNPKLQAVNLFNVNGIVAVVTGGGSGIGFMIANALANNGAKRVFIAGRRLDVLNDAARRIGLANVMPLYCDVTSKVSLGSLVSLIEGDTGYVNVVFANAGIGESPPDSLVWVLDRQRSRPSWVGFPTDRLKIFVRIGGPNAPTPDARSMSLEQWAKANLEHPMEDFTSTFNVNVSSVWYTAMAFLPLLDRGNKVRNVTQSSQVVATSSIAAFNKAAPGGSAYGISKAAVVHMMKMLGTALPQWGIRANCMAPGLFPSEMADPIIARAGGPQSVPIPLGRIGDEEDMAGLVLYLASRAGAYLNGNTVLLDGGRLTCFPSTF
ncbi:hypothetical protein MKZ38_001493 [Zalerion maritima]|uniref:Uncharacterized protein n=1 Tax=Zalerion maritima TaxID=339359 RepID=A0AAD5S5G9_9PEZI|nr:hypothetical protein MKZ38_001493 [Zalerion maritima]